MSLRIVIQITTDEESFEVVRSRDLPVQRSAAGRDLLAANKFRLASEWEQAQRDAQNWINERVPPQTAVI